MAKTDWHAIAELFAIEQEKTGISAKDWCEANGYNYQSARRYLKVRRQASAQKKTAQNKQRTSEKTAQKKMRKPDAQVKKPDHQKERDEKKSDPAEPIELDAGHVESPQKPKRPLTSTVFKPGNRAAVKHSGYAKYFDRPEYFADAAEFSLWDELQFTRARVLSVTKNMRRIQTDLDRETDPQIKVDLYKRLAMIEQALDRNIARVESLERSISNIQVNQQQVPKIEADTTRIREDTKRIQAATQKLTIETVQLSREENGDVTPMDTVMGELQTEGSGDLMSGQA